MSITRGESALAKADPGDLLSIASHELKTPVAVIRAYVEILLRRAEKAHNDADADLLRRIDEQAERMILMTEQILNLRRVGSGALPLEPTRFDIGDLVTRVAESLQVTAPEHTVIVTTGSPMIVCADHRQIEQVLGNLIANAVKFSPGGSRVEVRVAPERRPSGECAVVAVADEGVGLAEDERDRVFEPYYQSQTPQINAPTGPMGLGLGLYICRELVRRNGGEIWLESAPGKGSTFYFSLPLDGS